VRRGNALGLLINASLFGIVSVVIALSAAEVYGDATHDLVHLVAEIDNVTVLLVTIIAVAIATAGVNIICNFVAPVYDLINIRPGLFTFRRAGTLVAVLAVVVTPWNLFSSPVIVNQLIGGIGAFMGPLFGIIVVDYYLLRRKRIDTESLFTDRPDGIYFYRGGYNPRAIAALVIGGAVALLLTFVPAWADAVPFAWPAGILVGGLAYRLLNSGRPVRITPEGRAEAAAGPEDSGPPSARETSVPVR
jgi:NCS1 family nucleobase:cation symporter-1